MPFFGMYAQYTQPGITIKYPKNDRLVKYFPYATVQVIDNRLDTAKIYTTQTGVYPPQHVNFTEPASLVIKKYIESSVGASEKGAGELLINIEQLCIPNIHRSLERHRFRREKYKWLVKKSKRGENITNAQPRMFLHFMATAWYRNEQGNYNKLVTIKRKVDHYSYSIDKYVIPRLLNDCINAIVAASPGSANGIKLTAKQQSLLNDTASYRLARESEHNIPFEQINVNVRNRWKDYAVIKENSAVAGISYVFEDFKNNRVSASIIRLVYSEKDSFYRSTGSDTMLRKQAHWGVYDGTNWFIHLSDSSYFKLTKQSDTYGLYIPGNLPDMYALLSIEENYINYSSYKGGSGGGNILVGLAAVLVSAAVDGVMEDGQNNKMVKRIRAEGLKHNYRYCTIDMDNGDIIYQDK